MLNKNGQMSRKMQTTKTDTRRNRKSNLSLVIYEMNDLYLGWSFNCLEPYFLQLKNRYNKNYAICLNKVIERLY